MARRNDQQSGAGGLHNWEMQMVSLLQGALKELPELPVAGTAEICSRICKMKHRGSAVHLDRSLTPPDRGVTRPFRGVYEIPLSASECNLT